MAVHAVADIKYAGLIGGFDDVEGVVVEGEQLADFFALDARGLAEVTWHDPARGYMDPAGFADEQGAN